MKAIILAAGQGTRLKKYTEKLPKGMLEFRGKTLIKHQIDTLRNVGIEDIIIVKGFESNKINYDHVRYYVNNDYATTNMVASLLMAKKELNDDVIVCYSDIIYSEELINKMITSETDIGVAVDTNWEEYWLKRYDKINFDTESLDIENDKIVSLGVENPPLGTIDGRFIGLVKFSKRVLPKILQILPSSLEYEEEWGKTEKKFKNIYMTDLLQELIHRDFEVEPIYTKNQWLEFDTNEDYERAIKWSKNELSTLINISK